ncbi:4-hydroxy-tetrahydrodipicolinate synthase [Asticcacaulis sp. EMRT-3]|uniref:4-hydroxy-tetrahydrodipicolinate synthase n=1 Tax=Asticcacaulis sp. EMRT-3 TaxID=3040349 RepID=UPI0024AFB89E|nr:4-hydroxy-tetrahydrodipicolinate synthase [Asticcacaulis sp. EMRT-3]MDI7774358.1 4-hydroxy-tetrahydrodipicolinate synthase [Asticcacaulis sp. EMRT-3]
MSDAKPTPLFQGIFTALVTPFRNGEVDYAAFERLVERQIAAGVHGLVPVGTTGETSTLSLEEHKAIVRLCVEKAAGRVRVIAGAGSNNTAETLELAHHAKAVGADAVLVVAPYYNKPSQEGLYQHFKALNDSVQIPAVLYNVPGRTVVDMSNETIARLAELPNIVGIKDATGALDRMSQLRVAIGGDFSFISGDDPTFLGYLAHGGHGVISVTSNVAPASMVALYDAVRQGAYDTALDWQDRLIGLHKVLFADASPSPTKYAMSRLGLCTDEVRLPITPCAQAVRPLVDQAMAVAGLDMETA